MTNSISQQPVKPARLHFAGLGASGTAIAVFAVLGAIPLFTSSSYVLFVATQVWVYFAVALGLNFLSGYGGQTSIGHGALMLPVALVCTAAVGAVMAIPAFRVSAWYFALITLAFTQVVQSLLVEWQPFTHGFAGVIGIAMPSIGSYVFTERDLYWTVFAFCMLAFYCSRNLIDSRYGRALLAMRDNPLAAMGSGVSLVRLKLFAFAYSAVLTGGAGAFFAVQKTVITPDDFSGELSIFFLLVVVLGGMGRLYGPLYGTLAFFLLPELLSDLKTWRLLIYGIGLLLLVRFAPDGIAGALTSLRERYGFGRPQAAPVVAADVKIPRVRGARLQVDAVGKRFGGVAALQGVSLDVEAGSVHALVGPNGSGKTTLLNLITGFYPFDDGRIEVDGIAVRDRSTDALARDGIRRSFQTPKLVPELSVLENVMLGTFASEKAGLAAVMLNFPSAQRERAEREAEAMNYLRFVGLDPHAGQLAGKVPHGQQRLVEIARALVARPRLLLLDEPAAGLSMSELDGLVQLIRAISDIGTTIVIVEHHLDMVASLAQHVTVLEQGKVLATGKPASVFTDERVIAAYMGARALRKDDEVKAEVAHA
jgi:ABC-type branched-subunit amino acid transport system ATPase component/ABC-type branched-subunit amino acid transport system permease subunit